MNEHPSSPWARRPDVRVGAVVAVAIAVAFVVWLLVRGGDSNTAATTPSTTTGQATGPVETTTAKLRALSVELGHPIYWAGPLPKRTYELTHTTDGRIFIRYLPRGVPVGIRQAAFTIVGTYPVDNAYKVLRALAKKAGESSLAAPVGGFAVYSTAQPANVYLAYPGSNLQIEVYDPSPTRARGLITSGQVEPVR
ncbi:MAG: hypothetical protein M3R39_10235 [Actinomycetota bacterium]|nr:hypothetical protein [Actinomycetota bacterium]